MIQKQKNNHKSNGESKKTHRICVRETEAIDFGEEMSAEEKNKISHRAKALCAMKEELLV